MTGERPDGNKGWKVATAVLAVIAVAVGAFGFVQYRTADSLAGQLATATADARQAHEAVAGLKAQLSAVQMQASNEQQQLAAAQQQVSSEQRQLENTETTLANESRPDLPIKLTFRNAFLGAGKVAMLQNLSNTSLEVVLEVQSPATGAHFRRAYVINPGAMGQIGEAQGWPFAPGQLVRVSNPKYRPLVQTVAG